MTTELTPTMRRSILIATLRDKTLWPKDFVWNYAHRCTCAIGLAERVFGQRLHVSYSMPCSELGLEPGQSMNLFNNGYGHQGNVTPEMVADRLEEMHRSLA